MKKTILIVSLAAAALAGCGGSGGSADTASADDKNREALALVERLAA